MWKKLFYLVIIIWLTKSAQSAVLTCFWPPQTPEVCNPLDITSVTQPNEVITIDGKPSNYINSNTTFLTFTNRPINYVPSGLVPLFSKLQGINLEFCDVTTLTTNSIPNCGQLISFGIRGGTFTHIPDGFIQSCSGLTYLSVTEGSVATIDENALRGLTSLTILFIINSNLASIPVGLFQNTPSLKELYLTANRITVIDTNHFANLPKLTHLMVDQNSITYIPFLNLSVSRLYFGVAQNPINAIAPNFCASFASVESTNMNVYYFNITCVPDSAFSRSVSNQNCYNNITEFQPCYDNWYVMFPTTVPPTTIPPTTIPPTTVPLTTVPPTTAIVTTPSPIAGTCPSDKVCRYFLDQYNRYTCILDGVDSVLTSISGNHLITFADSNVRRVIFTNSFLSRIPPILFQKFTSLEYLTVSNCSMSAINTNTFTACGSLKYFDASSNFITAVDGASFKSCSALEVIDLTGNKFDMISGQLFVNNPTLKAVYINRPPAMVLV